MFNMLFKKYVLQGSFPVLKDTPITFHTIHPSGLCHELPVQTCQFMKLENGAIKGKAWISESLPIH